MTIVIASPPIPLLYDDASLLVADKPAGVPVIPAPGAGQSLRGRLEAQVGSRLWVVHRIDRDTSGAVAFARTPEAHRALSMAFEQRHVEKAYVAVVRNAPSPPAGTIATALHPARKGKMRPARAGEPGALEARTEYHVTRVWRHDGAAVAAVDARPFTGRHHQIRVHLRSVGTPILRDVVYGGRESAVVSGLPMARLALHARRLVLVHPVSARQVVVEAPEPDDFRRLRAHLDAAWTVAT